MSDEATRTAREIVHPMVLDPLLCVGLELKVAVALRAERDKALEEAAKVLTDHCALKTEEIVKLIRALKGKP